jgi:SgrR family transcriptional regulator
LYFHNTVKGVMSVKLESHYLRLYSSIEGNDEGSGTIAVTMDEIAAILECTHRNAVLLIRRMCDNGWLSWKPKRGRGHRSELRFLADTESIILRMAQTLVERRDLRGAIEQLQVPSIPVSVRDRFHEWLSGYFGHQSVRERGTRIDTLRFPLNGPLQTLDPVYMNYTMEAHLANQLFDSLVRRQPGSDRIQPHVAHAWDTDTTRTEWTFYLRKGVLFHHGRELRAEDVRFTMERLASASHPLLYRWAFEGIKSVQVIDPYTIRMTLRHPNELFLLLLSTYRTSILPADIVQEYGERFGRQPSGTGPFRLTGFDEALLMLEAHPAYFRGRAHLDRVEIWNVPDLYRGREAAALQQFQMIHNARVPTELADRWSKTRNAGMTCKFVTFNARDGGTLTNPKALSGLFDVIRGIHWEDELEGTDVVTATGFMAEDAGSVEVAEVAEMGAVLAGMQLELCTIPHYEEDARILQAACRKAGIELAVTLLTPEQFKTERRLSADLLLFALPLDDEKELRMIDLYYSMLRHLPERIGAETERMLFAIVREPSSEARGLMFRKLEGLLSSHLSLLVLYKKRLTMAYHPSVQGVPLDELGWMPFRDIWFKADQASE